MKNLYEVVNIILCLFLLTSCSSQRNFDSAKSLSVNSFEKILGISFVDDANGEITCYTFPDDDADESQIYILYPVGADVILEKNIYQFSEEFNPLPSSENYLAKDMSFLSLINIPQEQVSYVNTRFTEYNFDGAAIEREISIYIIEKSSNDFYIMISTLYPENIQIDASAM